MKDTALNIHNLGQLWIVAGQAFQGFKGNTEYSISTIANSEWPNRIWAKQILPKAAIHDIKLEMAKDDRIVFSHFSEEKKETPSLSDKGFELKSIQYGMSLPLTTKFKTEKNLFLNQVNNKADAEAWSAAFFKAFKYRISEETVMRTREMIPYFLVYHQQELVGTIVLFATGKVMGIHSLGIVPSQRKKGFGKEIMHHVLNASIEKNYETATLQASEMAKTMYLKMGFSYDFRMENYRLKQ